ncbi:glycosyltransferase [Euzebyella marina]|uniref:Glycosyltransferase n=1 Tax=Euzebyella marina TaxID=1761453 RepID=A0A3G2L379_9FLAO|nr:glycosyltransferase family 4 protein [Euzebyella marina]AYN66678.1 glycosyltransferase [Euzebyella marina]
MIYAKPKITYLTQVPGPYREKMHLKLGIENSYQYSVIYCARLEPNRTWNLELENYEKFFLADRSKTYRHNNPQVWKLLNNLDPDVLIITAFKPTMLYAVFWCILKKRKVVVYNDGTLESEKDFSKIQKLIRKQVFKRTQAFVGPGKGAFDLYRSYGVSDKKMFKSCLCIDNSRFNGKKMKDRKYDLLFSGQIIARKLPLLFVEVAKKIRRQIPSLKVLILGDGDLKNEMLNELDKAKIDYDFKGFLDQNCLPAYYADSKVFLFPTLNDPWGIVANEACASGTPVVTTEVAGVANDLILHGVNGLILPVNTDIWATEVCLLLEDENKLSEFSRNAINLVKEYNHEMAAQGIIESVEFALKN